MAGQNLRGYQTLGYKFYVSMYGMSYFGADRSTARTFMGYLKLADGQLTTVYLEGFNMARKDFADCLQSLTECL